MKHLKRKVFAGIIILGIVICAVRIVIYAGVDEYKVRHDINIDLAGGKCTDIYYESQEDRGPNAGKWFKGLRIGEYLEDRLGKYHTIAGYNASIPKDGETVSNYYDCVGVTPYVRIDGISRDGYIFKGWEILGAGKSYYDMGTDGVRVDIGAYTDKDITIRAKWERCSYDFNVNIYYLSDDEQWTKEKIYSEHARMNIDINDSRKAASAYFYSGKVAGDSVYSIVVGLFAGWKIDREYSGSFKGIVLEDTNIDIYIRPIVYEVHLYDNKPQTSSSDIKNKDYGGWQWDENGYYKKSFIYDRAGELPHVSDMYELTGWTGVCWQKEDESFIYPYTDIYNKLVTKDGTVVNLKAVWKENAYTLNLDVNSGYEDDQIIVTGYEKGNKLPDNLTRPGYNFDSWNSDRDGNGTRYEKGDTVSKLVDDDSGIYNIYAQWTKKKRICLKVSSGTYKKALINDSVYNNAQGWFDEYGMGGTDDERSVPDEKCIQIWTINDDGIKQNR